MVVSSSAPTGGLTAISQRRAGLAGPSGIKGLMSNLRIFAIAVFASLGGLVYGCMCLPLPSFPMHFCLVKGGNKKSVTNYKIKLADNQGMFGQILNMTSFSNTVHPESITNPTLRGFLTA